MIEEILQHALLILQQDGELSTENGLTPSLIYQDDRIELIGQLSPELKMMSIVLNLNLDPGSEARFRMIENTRPFTLPRSEPAYNTAVLQWHAEGGLFIRPGLWSTYLGHLARQIKSELEAFAMLNNVPVDDSALFADIPLNQA